MLGSIMHMVIQYARPCHGWSLCKAFSWLFRFWPEPKAVSKRYRGAPGTFTPLQGPFVKSDLLGDSMVMSLQLFAILSIGLDFIWTKLIASCSALIVHNI
eukprot:969609-Amphidinium_carterae.2